MEGMAYEIALILPNFLQEGEEGSKTGDPGRENIEGTHPAHSCQKQPPLARQEEEERQQPAQL